MRSIRKLSFPLILIPGFTLTKATPPKKAAIPTLEKKLQTAALVQESLRNLMVGTEDTFGQEDAELLGHIVNYETSVHPRRRWKVQVK